MEIIILKIVACVCLTIVVAIMALQDEEDKAFWLFLLGLAVIFVPWDKILNY